MYAIGHASTALLLRRKVARAPMLLLLIAVQLLELIWVLLTALGIEHISVSNGLLHLDYLPYSHSLATGLLLAGLAWLIFRFGFGRSAVGLAVAIGILSHVVLDAIFHEPDIRLAPWIASPLLGLSIVRHPYLDFTLETLFCIVCWRIFRGSKPLLAAILVFSLLNLPMMLGRGDVLAPFASNRLLLPAIILVQILLTTIAVAYFSRERASDLGKHPLIGP